MMGGVLDKIISQNYYDRKTRAQLDDGVETKLRKSWFDNYERNKPDIAANGGIIGRVQPTTGDVIVVGAGWSLKKNVHLLAKVPDVPVITCDKAAPIVAKYVTPYAICALNTDKTRVKDWLRDFYEEMKKRDADPSDVWLVVPVTVNPEIFEEWKGKVAFVNPQNTSEELTSLVFAQTNIPATSRGDNSGYFSVITAVMFGATKVIMLGLNYCYQTESEAETQNEWAQVRIRDVRDVRVFTLLDWLDARRELVDFCMDMMSAVQFINCSEAGLIYQTDVIDALDFKVWIRYHLQNKAKEA